MFGRGRVSGPSFSGVLVFPAGWGLGRRGLEGAGQEERLDVEEGKAGEGKMEEEACKNLLGVARL